jgi:hypothetical protein
VLGRGAFEGGDDDGFFVNGVRYSWDDAFYSCLDDFDGFTFGQFACADDDADEDATGDGAAGAGEDAEEGAAVPEPTTPTTTMTESTALPTTGANTLLLTLLRLGALGGGMAAVNGSRRSTRGNG